MVPDLNWMIGSSLVEVEKIDYTWFFSFDGGTVIAATDSPWRFVKAKGIVITSEDHGHQFGLPAPVNAAEIIKAEAIGKKIDNAIVDERTGDLTVTFGESILSFLCLSMGYEAWHLTHGSLELVCMGGGRVARIEKEKDQRTNR